MKQSALGELEHAMDIYKGGLGSIDDVEAARKMIMSEAQRQMTPEELAKKPSIEKIMEMTQKRTANEESGIPDTQQLFASQLAGQLPEAKGGTTRNVFDLGNAVAKVAKDPKGLQQNKAETINAPNTPKPLEKGKDYVITEKAQRDDHTLNKFLKPLRDFDSEDFEKKNPKLIKLMKDMGLGHFLKYKLLWGDFTAARNWGIDKNGQPTLLDKGTLDSSIYDHDHAPSKVQREYEKIKEERRRTFPVRTHRRELGGDING